MNEAHNIVCLYKTLHWILIYFPSYLDDDECESLSTNDCHDNATCTNTEGSYSCFCNDGFTPVGDKVCAGKYSKTCLKRTCSKADTCLKRTKYFVQKCQFPG